MSRITLALAVMLSLAYTSLVANIQKGLDAYNAGDFIKAVEELEPLAESGDADAQFLLGYMYLQDDTPNFNKVKSRKWIRLAATQGMTQAQQMLGGLYQDDKDYVQAVKWYRLAAQQGDVRSKVQLGHLSRKGLGLPQNYTKSVEWFRSAAEQGDPTAQASLADMYRKGLGVSEDQTQSVKWFSLAAKQGDSYSQRNLAFMYFLGKGVPENTILAHMWFNILSASGDEEAATTRDQIANDGQMSPSDVSKAQAMASECIDSGYKNCGDQNEKYQNTHNYHFHFFSIHTFKTLYDFATKEVWFYWKEAEDIEYDEGLDFYDFCK